MNDSASTGSADHAVDLMDRFEKSGRTLSAHLPQIGHAVWLCTRSGVHRLLLLQDLEWRIFPPVLLDQCRLYFDRASGLPMAFASWALLSEQAERDYVGSQRLAPGAWRSGERPWLIDVVAPFGGARRFLRELCHETLRGVDVRLLYPDDAGRPTARTLREVVDALPDGPGGEPGDIVQH